MKKIKSDKTATEVQKLNKLIDYCVDQGVTIMKTHEGQGEFQFLLYKRKRAFKHQIIRINKYLPKTALIHIVLHEMGHRELILSGLDEQYKKLYNDKFYTMLTEMLAWHKGLEIAKKAKIKINQKGYFTFANKALRTYVGSLFFLDDKEVPKIEKAINNFF